MASSVTVPVWVAVAVAGLAVVALIDRLFGPALRWWMRRRANRAIDELNQRLSLKIPPFKLARRGQLIEQLMFDPEVLKAVEDEAAWLAERLPVHPSPEVVAVGQDRLAEKQRLARLGIPTAPWADAGELEVGFPTGTILKRRTGGFDGRGQLRLGPSASPVDVDAARHDLGAPAVAESVVAFERELSVVAARSPAGDGPARPRPLRREIRRRILRLYGNDQREPVERARGARLTAGRSRRRRTARAPRGPPSPGRTA